jgi:hypothetical protein
LRRSWIPILIAAWSLVAAAASSHAAAAPPAVAAPGFTAARRAVAAPGDTAPPAVAPARGDTAGPAQEAAPVRVEEIVSRYNEGIRRVLGGVERLQVGQTIFEPQEDGSAKRACAILRYQRGEGMVRDETYSELVYPVGDYTLRSLAGPVLDLSEYRVEYAGMEEAEGVPCHLLEVTATARDYHHFDGSVWISSEDFAPVRIVGEVADPPFPAKHVTLDKVFAEGPHGLRLVRRHTGRGEFQFLFLTKRGERTIYYDDYDIEFVETAENSESE